RRILSFQAFLHLLRGDNRVIVFGDDAPRDLTHVVQTPGTPCTQRHERYDKHPITGEQLCSEIHIPLTPQAFALVSTPKAFAIVSTPKAFPIVLTPKAFPIVLTPKAFPHCLNAEGVPPLS